jgi:hypothetical protein
MQQRWFRMNSLLYKLAYGVGRKGTHFFHVYNNLKRPRWLRIQVPIPEFVIPSAGAVLPEDVAYCERLINAYYKSLEQEPDISDIWQGIFALKYSELKATLKKRDAEKLAALMSSLFQQDYLYGVSSSTIHNKSGIDNYYFATNILEHFVSLAEYLGVIHVESPEQGAPGLAFGESLEVLVAKIEAALGIPIGFPDVGAAYGLKIGGRLITPEAPEYIYVALRIIEAMKLHLKNEDKLPAIVEIGAGYGGTAYWLLQQCRLAVSNYTIIDLPLMNVSQGYFLGKAFGYDRVILSGEPLPLTGTKVPYIRILPTYAILNGLGSDDVSFDVVFNENSMPEMNRQSIVDYLMWMRRHLYGIFYSYNHESTGGALQFRVPDVVKEVDGFERLTRNFSWVRFGYVEEVYACNRR